jgi:hypothetical protein
MESGLMNPTLSAKPSRTAPAFAAASKTCRISSIGVLVASISMKLTVVPCFLAYSMLSTILASACSLVSFSLYCRFNPLMGDSIVMSFTPHSMQAVTLFFVASAEAVSLE